MGFLWGISYMRFEYKILDDGEIEILIEGRDSKDQNGKFLDEFCIKKFRIESTELITFRRLLSNASFEWCNKFNKSLDYHLDPEKEMQ
jgi:hypothetical protein